MVAIVSGNNLGLNLSSLATLGEKGVFGAPTQGSSGQRAYVNIATGNLVLQSQDDLLAARGDDAVALRTYNSQGLLNDDNGDNWSSGFWLQPLALTGTLNAAGSTLTRTDRDGSVGLYTFDAAAALYRSTDGEGAYDTIRYVSADTQLEWRDGATGATERYEAGGSYRLLLRRDTAGNALTYGYNAAGRLASVLTASGDTTFYDYAGNNLIQVRTVPAGGAGTTDIRYAYDASNRLATVTVDLTPADNSVADGKVFTTTYSYVGTSRQVARAAQSDGSSLAFTYIGDKVATVTDGVGQVTAFTYLAGSVQVKDPLTLVTVYSFDASGRLAQVTQPSVAGVSSSKAFSYSATGDLLSVRDGEGRTTVFQYDANGNRLLERDAAGNTISRTFDARNQVLTETEYAAPDPDGSGAMQPGLPLTTRYAYDFGGRNQLRFVISAEGRVTEHRYDAFGQRTSTLVYAGSTYPVAGLSVTAAPAEADMAAWAASQPKAAVQRQDMGYDARGSLASRTTYANLDANGAGIVDGTQSRETFVYDQGGALLQSVSASGAATAFSYDGLGRVVSSTDALGRLTTTSYIDASNRSVTYLANGRILATQYDSAGRLLSASDLTAANVAFGETKYFYDIGGRLRMTEDPTAVRHWYLYDEAGRKVADIDGNGTLTEYRYDLSDRLVATEVYATRVNTALLMSGTAPNLAARLADVRPAETGAERKTWRSYDAAGRLFQEAQTVGIGSGAAMTVAVTETLYDGASRMKSVTRYANTTQEPLASGARFVISTPATSAKDRVARNYFDGDNLLAGSLDAEGYLTDYQYDGAGRMVQRRAYATVTTADPRTATLAQLIPAASADDQRTLYFYDAKGRLSGEVDAEGYLTETVRDAVGNVTQTKRYANRVAQSVSASSSLAAIRPSLHAMDRTTVYGFDANNRLVRETSAEGTVKEFVYDAVGNLTSTTLAAGTVDVRILQARYDQQGRLTGELSAEGAALLVVGQTQAQVDAIWTQYGTSYAYDAAGRRISSTDELGSRTLFFYDEDGSLRYTVDALGQVRERSYDVQGRLASEVSYVTPIVLTGLSGGLVTNALTSAIKLDSLGDSRVTYGYTRDDRVASTTDALGATSTTSYDAFGQASSTSLPTGAGATLTSTYTFDRRGLQTGQALDTGGVNAQSTTAFDAFGRGIRTIDANGNVREQGYDRLGRVVTTLDPLRVGASSSYDAFGRVLTQVDALGRSTIYAYDATTRTMTLTTPEGISTTTSFDRHGQVIAITDGKGQVKSFSYDRNGKLLHTTTALTNDGNVYDAVGRLVESIDAGGGKVTYVYDAANRLLERHADPAGLNLVTSYRYDAKGQRIRVTDPNQVVTTIEYDRKGQVLKQTVDPGGLNLATVYSYDARGLVLSVATPGGMLTQYGYDALGRRTSERVDPAGLDLRRSWTYDKNGNVRTSTDATLNVTRYIYDAADRLQYTIDPAGGVRQTLYDAAGRVSQTLAYVTAIDVTSLGSTPTEAMVQGLLNRQLAAPVVEHRVYDRDGRLVATVDGAGAVVRFTYDANGNVALRTACANVIDLATWTRGTVPSPVADATSDQAAATVYDALDRAIYTVDGTGALVAQTYDGNGRVLQRIAYAEALPVGTTVSAQSLTMAAQTLARPGRDAVVRNVYDAAGRLAWQADGMGAVTQFVRDKNGNVVRQVNYATAVTAAASPATVPASAADRSTSMTYDAANRLVLQVDALNGVVEQAYDGNGDVVRRTAYATPISGTTITANPALDRTTLYGYDAARRQAMSIDAMGAAVLTSYDAAGRIVMTTAYAKPIAAGLPSKPSLDVMKAFVAADQDKDRITRYAYDAAGRLAYTVDPSWAATGTKYDDAGRVSRTTRYWTPIATGTPITSSALDTAVGLVANPALDQATAYAYDAAGRVIRQTDALGAAESYQYDALGNKRTFTNKNGSVWTYTYDTAGRLRTETSPAVQLGAVVEGVNGTLAVGLVAPDTVVTKLAYDALGNLTSRTEAYGRPEARATTYGYDAVGRQVLVVAPKFRMYAASTDAVTSNGANGLALRTESLEISPETRTYYDALGNAVANVQSATGAPSILSQKVYDRLGRVAYEVDALGHVTGYTRNAFGEVTDLVRYGNDTVLADRTVSQASQAVTKTQVDTAVASASGRVLKTAYDRAGRATTITEPAAYVSVLDENLVRHSGYAGRTTSKTYDAFGRVVEERMLRDADGTWSVTTHYYDRAGNETATVDALGYLTTRVFDSRGNLLWFIEYANAVTVPWSPTGYTAPPASADNRTTEYAYDRLDRKTVERKWGEYSAQSNGESAPGCAVTYYDYDAVGNQTRVTDAEGGVTCTFYDALGRVAAVAAPVRAVETWTGAVANLAPLKVFTRDAHGNVVVTTECLNGAANGGTAPVPSAWDPADRKTVQKFDSAGHLLQHTNAEGATEFFSYDAQGNVAKKWQAVTDNAGATRTLFEVDVYDKLGRLAEVRSPKATTVYRNGAITNITQAEAGVDTTLVSYNAFGEMIQRSVNGDRGEVFEYDGAGRLWRTNSGDGSTRIQLFDAQGNVTSDIRSAGSGNGDFDVMQIGSAQEADARPMTRRIDTRYDAMGHAVATVQAARRQTQDDMVTSLTQLTSASILSSSQPFSPGDSQSPTMVTGANQVALSWRSLTALGSGDVKVTLHYRAPTFERLDDFGHVTVDGGQPHTFESGIFTGEQAATGVTLNWVEASASPGVGIGSVARIVVQKKDLYGGWQVVIDQAPGYGANEIDVAAPPQADAALTLEMRAEGTAGDNGWWSASLVNFGDRYRFDGRGLPAGSYEYRVSVQPPGQDKRVTASGRVAVSSPPLDSIPTSIAYGEAGAGVLAWHTPAGGISQVLRYRVAGSTGPWTSLDVMRRNPNFDGVDTSNLQAGTYQFELLWTPEGQTAPTAHATGTFAVTAGTPGHWEPPINLPHITGLHGGSATVNGVNVPTIEWPAANANVAIYSNGGNWLNLPIETTGATQRVVLGGLPVGAYGLAIYADAPLVSKQAVAFLSIFGPSAGYYETVYVDVPTSTAIVAYNEPLYETRQGTRDVAYQAWVTDAPEIVGTTPVYETRSGTREVAYQVWVNDPPVVIGQDESGAPVYSYPGHYETSYRTETYSYQVLVRYDPVYARDENNNVIYAGHYETRYRTETYDYQVQVGTRPVYARDENNNILYTTGYAQVAKQVWVDGAAPTPAVTVVTPAYSPGYWTGEVAKQYSASVTTAAGSSALSGTMIGAFSQTSLQNMDDQWQRPQVRQKFDRWGNVVEVSDPRSVSWKTTYRYNASNQLIEQRQPDADGAQSGASPVTRLYYDRLGRQVATRDANGYVTGKVFDAGGNVVEDRQADGGSVKYSYNVFGEKLRTTSAEGRVVTFTYDKLGRQTSVAKGVEGVYRVVNRLASLVDTRNITEQWAYDQLGRKLWQANGNGEKTSYSYDLQGNVIQVTQPMGQSVRAAFDAQGRKVAETDAAGRTATWTYDYFGQLAMHTDIGGQTYVYCYDLARQMFAQTSGHGQALEYTYDPAGQVTKIVDKILNKQTTYAYDLSGRRVRERTAQANVTYQDNHLAYDALGNLRDVADGRVHITMEYDKVGNRTRVKTSVDYQGVGGEAMSTTDRYFRYDEMNRQIVVDAVDATGRIEKQGHTITYDHDGNRTSDTSWGNVIVATGGNLVIVNWNHDTDEVQYGTAPVTFSRQDGMSVEQYRYDALDRLTSVLKDGVQIDVRLYDGADRVIQSGPTSLPSGNYGALINEGLQPGDMNGKERRVNRYDANGLLLQQTVYTPEGREKVDMIWDPNADAGGFRAAGYDAAGNVNGYLVHNHETSTVNKYTNQQVFYEGYQVGRADVVSSKPSNTGSTTQQYDVNGFLIGIVDSTQHANDRTFVNDASGRALFVNQGGNVQRQLIVNGEVLGIYGAGVDPVASGSNPSFANLVDFDFGYSRISASYPTPSPGAYTVRSGDTLQSIAQGAYGDSALWYRIAEANGLASSKDLKVGTTLNIPNRVSTIHNNSGTFKLYDPSRIEGDKTPNLPMPANDKGCGGVGTLIMVIVAVVATILTAGAAALALGSATTATVGAVSCTVASGASVFGAGMAALAGGSFAGVAIGAGAALSATAVSVVSAVVGAAVGSIASQGVGIAMGMQERLNWKSVALSSVSAGMTAGIGAALGAGSASVAQSASIGAEGMSNGLVGAEPAAVAARAALSNVATQGIGIATGLQRRFDWRGVAASYAGSLAGSLVGEQLPPASTPLTQFGNRLISGTAAAMVVQVMRGGRVAAQQVAVDAFGNAMGSSLASASSGAGEPTLTTGDFTRMDRASDPYQMGYQDADGHLISDAEQLQRVRQHGDLYAGGPELRLESLGVRGAASPDAIARQRAAADVQKRIGEMQKNMAEIRHAEAMQANEEYSANEARRLQARMQLESDPFTFASSAGLAQGLRPSRGVLNAFANGQESGSVLEGEPSLSLGEKGALGLRGLVQMPVHAAVGLAKEIGGQYTDLYNIFTSSGASYVPSSAVARSLRQNGVGGALLNAGRAIFSAPSQPVIDFLEGRYEQAGAGLPGAVAFGTTAIRGMGLRGGPASGVFAPDTPYVVRYDPAVPGRPDPRFSIDSLDFKTPTSQTSNGGLRSTGEFWSQWLELRPESISSSNRYLIDNFDRLKVSPRVDATWIKAFPEHGDYMRDVLVHHHVDFGRYAIPVPGKTHVGSGGPWHLGK